MKRPRLRVVYVERGAHASVITWCDWGAPIGDPKAAGRDAHRVFRLMMDRAGYDRANRHGRVIRVGRSLLAEAVIDRNAPRPTKAAVVVSGVGRRPGWAGRCAAQAAAVLSRYGVAASTEAIETALRDGWRDSRPPRRAPFVLIRRLLAWPHHRQEKS